jgi:hypothetical protein
LAYLSLLSKNGLKIQQILLVPQLGLLER